jgi:D-3-phosphoglycerate dehydrogenase / 2-oxoglutarate reductase
VNSTAEHTIYLILNILRNNYLIDKRNFFKKRNVQIREINKKNIGIIGYGRLGRKVDKILKSFGANTFIHDIKNIKNKTKLNTLIKKSDIITLHIPLNEKNINFFDNQKFLKLKNNSILVNTSRGEIVDQKALLKYIKIKKIKYATDVLHSENNIKSNKTNKELLKLMKKTKNVHITPHIGGLSQESIQLTDEFIINKFEKLYKKK